MRFESGEAFRDWPAKAVTVFGMSGVGKTSLGNMLRRHDWFHYSVDYRIGTRYMGEYIVDEFKREAMKVPLLRQLLMTDSIYISSNITFDNLAPLSTYLGKPGNPDRGGISFAEYRRRQAQHKAAEIAALLDVPEFIEKARTIYGYARFLCDSGGSLCEVVDPDDPNDPVLKCLSEHTLLLYIRGTEQHKRMLVDRFRAAPKPMYYPEAFLEESWADYKRMHGLARDEEVDPDGFAVWGFEQLLDRRIPYYEAIARNFGYTIEADEVAGIVSEAGFVSLVSRAIDQRA
ncbi:ATPase [Kaustia mangrovi]|uniref:ATPase n=1 Tax=Kaustia mangrovi TaxID=2593653 RepID=A0A7S8HE75_9HYPH|nr:ATPase [Kaustia mangrovi]QPC45088.1 ATPase [Kaustia mangrovi]